MGARHCVGAGCEAAHLDVDVAACRRVGCARNALARADLGWAWTAFGNSDRRPVSAHRTERSAGRVPEDVLAPAGDGGVGSEPARMGPAGGDGGERSVGRVDLSVAVVAPAGDGGVGSESARVFTVGGDGGERSVGRVDLSVAVPSPAGDGGVGSEPARMGPVGGDGGERSVGRVDLPFAVIAPAGDGGVGF